MIKQKQRFTLFSVPRLSSYFHMDSVMLYSQWLKVVNVCVIMPFYREVQGNLTEMK